MITDQDLQDQGFLVRDLVEKAIEAGGHGATPERIAAMAADIELGRMTAEYYRSPLAALHDWQQQALDAWKDGQ